VYAPVDTVTHLALFRINPYSDLFSPFMADQFWQGGRPVQQQPTEYLLVPSLKEEIVTDTKRQTWGKLKTLYR
jgi:hypothetical protein